MSHPSDDTILDALREACRSERGGWAAALPVSELLGVYPGAAGNYLARLVRRGHAESWTPKAGMDKAAILYRASVPR